MKNYLLIILLSAGSFNIFAQSTSDYGRNIVTVSPIQVIGLGGNDSEGDVGVNISYERISANEYFGLKIPITFSLKDPYYYFMPTLKIYPMKQGAVKYSFGPQFYLGGGERKFKRSDYNYPNTVYSEISKQVTQVGFMINNAINFTLLENLNFGLDLSLGVNYYDSTSDDADLNNNNYYYYGRNRSNFYPAGQLNFFMGYRF